MATITGTVNGSTPSAEVNPAETVSHYTIDPTNGTGAVELQKRAPGKTRWTTIAVGGSSPVNTPDLGYFYRFQPRGLTAAVEVYFGA